MNKQEVKQILNLFATDLISEIEKGMKTSNCNLCAKGYFESGMIVKKRLAVYLNRLGVEESNNRV